MIKSADENSLKIYAEIRGRILIKGAVTEVFVHRNWKEIASAIQASKNLRRTLLVDKCRQECGYSENTLTGDIWMAIVRKYNEIK